MVQDVVSFKSGGVAFIMAIFFGLFFFDGVGHMFIGKVKRGSDGGTMIFGWLSILQPFFTLLFY
jgi:hypothetical protein